ncbi:hypothetical protein PALA49_00739 [Pseudomonas aeruginosa]|nr:hypothetical protein [Pseudomonas aeruginosa]
MERLDGKQLRLTMWNGSAATGKEKALARRQPCLNRRKIGSPTGMRRPVKVTGAIAQGPPSLAGGGPWDGAKSDGAAAVLAVRLLRRIGHHVGFDLLHLSTAGKELLHRLGEGVTLFLLGFDRGSSTTAAFAFFPGAGASSPSPLSASPSSAAASSSPSSSSAPSSSSCSSSSSLMVNLSVLQKQVSYSPAARFDERRRKKFILTRPARWRARAVPRPCPGVHRDRSPARCPVPTLPTVSAGSVGSPAGWP